MTDDRLHQLLGAEPPASIRELDEATRADLADVIADARRRQAASLQEAFEATLKHVPLPFRGVVKRVVLG
jgi:hypothetical protein